MKYFPPITKSILSQILGLVTLLVCMYVYMHVYKMRMKENESKSEIERAGEKEKREVPTWRQIEKVMKNKRE